MKKSLLLLSVAVFLPLLFTLFSRCTPDQDYLYIRPNVLVFDTLAPEPRMLGKGDTTRFQSHYLTVLMPVEVYNASLFLPGVSSACASYKDQSYMRAIEQIEKIEIITLYPYRSFPAGSDISDSCLYFRDRDKSDSAFFSGPAASSDKKTIIRDMNDTRDLLNGFEEGLKERFSFRLPKAPASVSPQRFAVVFTTKEHSRYADTTDLFYLQP